jgi:hypothetical protein
MRWHYRDPLLAWLLPLSYALHILEEWFGGFPEWMAVMLALMRAWGQAEREMFVRGVVTGVGVHALVFVVAYAAGS